MALAAATCTTQAATFAGGGGTADWTDGANWGGTAPGTTITDHLLINASADYTAAQGDTAVSSELKIINNSTLSVLGGSISVTQSAGWDNILIGNTAGATGALLIDGGAFVQAANPNFVVGHK